MWSLAFPLALLLLPVPLLVRRVLPAQQAGAAALAVPPALAARLSAGQAGGGTRFSRWPPILLWTCLVLALAGPQKLVSGQPLPVSGRDIVLALDLSGSMEIEDFELDGVPVQRLDALKRIAASFVRSRAGDRLGLVIFGEEAYFAAPMSYDAEAVARTIEEATIGISGRSTAISQGLGLALKRLSESDATSRVVILLSDGIDTSSTVAGSGAAALAEELGVRVHTIAMGPLAVGEEGAGRDAVDAEGLAEIAGATGGTAFRVRTTGDLADVAAAIDAMEADQRSRAAPPVLRPYWTWPAGAAAVFGFAILLDRRRPA